MGGMIKFIQDHFIIFPLVITAVTAELYMSGIPFELLKHNIAGNNIFYIVNMIFVSIFCIAAIKTLYGEWIFGLNLYRINYGIFRYGWPLILGSIFIFIGSYYIRLVRQPGWLPLKSCNFSPCGCEIAVF
jgi:hypothetical protein